MRVTAALVSLYVLYGMVMVAVHPSFIYPFDQTEFSDPRYRAMTVAQGEPGATYYLYDGDPGKPVVLYFMGNVGAVHLFSGLLDRHIAARRGVAVLGYRGGGNLPGTPSERALKSDALAVYDDLRARVAGRAIVVHGFSLGSGLALHVAAQRPVAGVVLDAPYQRLCRLMARAAALPACVLPVQRWMNDRDAPQVTAPVLIQHGAEDRVVPVGESARLMSAFEQSAPRRVVIQGAGHNNLLSFPQFGSQVDAFIAGL